MTRSKHKLAVQAQKMAKGLQEVEGFALSIYIVHENKGTDQVRGNCAADLRLLFSHIEKKSCFLMTRLRYWLLFMPFPLPDNSDGCLLQAGFYGEILKIMINYMVSSYILQ